MDMKREFDEAIALGKANLSVLDLARNYCEYLQVEPLATGELEAATGLPIGMRRFDCEFAAGQRIVAMDLSIVALSFYDNNCANCTKRKPKAFPNLLVLVRERDQMVDRERTERERAAAEEQAAFESRDTRRSQLRIGLTATAAGLLDLIGDTDREISQESAAALEEAAKAAPERFGQELQEALRDLVTANGDVRVTAALRSLKSVASDRSQLVSLALDALRRNTACIAATEVLLDEDIQSAQSNSVATALPAVIQVAIPLRDFSKGDPPRVASACTTLMGLNRAFPSEVERIVRRMLNAEDKETRIQAAGAVEVILGADPSFGPRMAEDLLRSMTLPDDRYGPVGSAAHATSSALMTALRSCPVEIDSIIQRSYMSGSAPTSVLDVYRLVLRPNRESGSLDEAKQLRALAFRRLLDALLSPRSDDEFSDTMGFLDYEAKKNRDLLVDFTELLLGATALLVSQRDQLDRMLAVSPLALQVPADPFEPMKKSARKDSLNRAIRDLCKLVAESIEIDAAQALPPVFEILDNPNSTDTDFRSKLVRIVGIAAENRDVLPRALPHLYRAMTDVDVGVRREAATAYGNIASASAEDLPSLFHETFLYMLLDPFVAVHRAALEAISRVTVPNRYLEFATRAAWSLVGVHKDTRSWPAALVSALNAFCSLSRDADPRWSTALPQVVEIVRKMKVFDALEVAKRLAWRLSGVPCYVDLLLDLLTDSQLYFARSDLLKRIGREPIAEISRVAKRLREAAEPDIQQGFQIRDSYQHDALDTFTSLLADAEAWEDAEQLAHHRVDYLKKSRRNEGMKRAARAREISVAFSRAFAEGRIEDAKALRTEWSSQIMIGETSDFERWFETRLETFDEMAKCAAGTTDSVAFRALGERLTAVSAEIGDTAAGRAYRRVGVVVRAIALLAEYLDAIRNATRGSERFVRAAQLAGKELREELGESSDDTPMFAAAELLVTADENSIRDVVEAIMSVPIPLPLLPAFRYPNRPPIYDRDNEPKKIDVTVAIASFRINGQPLRENEVVEPTLLHNLEVDVVVSRWPESAGRLTLDVTTVELPDTFALPTFVFSRPRSHGPRYDLSATNRLQLKVAQAIGPRPLEFRYRAHFDHQEDMIVSVEGQRTLTLWSYDPEKSPDTGNPDIDRKLFEIRDFCRKWPGVRDSELGHFLLIMKQVASFAGQALQGGRMFPGKWNESRFQRRVVEFLRSDKHISSKLQEHAEAAAGVTDLTFHEMPIELKVQNKGQVTLETAVQYADQAIQYAVGNGRRFSVLVILDKTPNNTAPALASNDIRVTPQIQTGVAVAVPVLLGTVVIRGNVPPPSSHSRKRKSKKRKP